MSNGNQPDEPLHEHSLIEALDGLGVTEASSLAEALQAQGAVYLPRPHLDVALHFDLEPHILVLAGDVATLGIVEILPAVGDLEKEARERVDRATYVRHLLLTDPALGNRLPRAVELVLVAPRSTEQAVGKCLRTVARTTTYLHAIGVNELYHQAGTFDPDDLRRAFHWLLRATRAWYDEVSKTKAKPSRTLVRLQLQNYRLPGLRVFHFETDREIRAHLVHGHNGSGKSSIAEALELALTGTVERLDAVKEPDYWTHIVHESVGESGPAFIKLELANGDRPYQRQPVRNDQDTLDRALSSSSGKPRLPIKATGFRLDQTVMDRLSREGESQRLTTFLEAFFPEDANVYEQLHAKQKDRKSAFERLSPILRDAVVQAKSGAESFEDTAVRLYNGLEKDDQIPSEDQADALLPVPLADLRALAILVDGIGPLLSEWESARPAAGRLPDLLDRLDRELNEALKQKIPTAQARLRTTEEALESLRGWRPGTLRILEEDPAEILNAWLELCALIDLADKQLQQAKTLSEARQRGWSPDGVEGADLLTRHLPSAGEIAELEAQRDEWEQERKRRAEQAGSLGQRGTAEPRGPAATVPQLSDPQIDALNEIGPWIVSSIEAAATVPFGTLITEALVRRTTLSFGSIAIGGDEWIEKLQEQLKPLTDACTLVTKRASPDRPFQSAEAFRNLRKALAVHNEYQSINQRVKTTFVERFRPDSTDPAARKLREAVNELMALFTPTRWAYKDVGLSYESSGADTQDGRLPMTVQRKRTEGQAPRPAPKADLIFNTAELNVFTVALFLLCGPRIDNELGLLILDDPLQNMDELTVTTLARGVARMIRFLPDGWRLLLLFHGEDDLERFRREIPAAVYRLPWVVPPATDAKQPDGISVGADTDRKSHEAQKLDKLLRELPTM